jgi:cell division protein FtsL
MKRGKMKFMTVLITLVLMSAVPLAAMASEPVTIQGEVNDSYQIVDSSGQVYEIAETEKGNDLVENHIGEKAKVVGTLQQDQDVKIITITEFEILAE